ncbi:HlyD family type I secretion periplasmic adaptor subunit [Oricola sp.]|uniref:HlyD family type I secretion periplasmic adaptor subunit n=1 Tax=Oricola sp. TaxID=1979950 RepID=UPI0025DD73DC|nr:HlyD family type I secretion periplasmic adaptor subunit [Oricola sp.]MCI5077134.1 HlyD family type I secretion periplasmic adaptor subunit [Oricola sp.]
MAKAQKPSAPASGDWAGAVRTGTAGVALLGYASIALFVGVFGVWAATAPLGGAAIVSGVIAAAGQNQVVQHLEGGIIQSIHVHEGDRVSAGDPLFTMDDTRARATLNTRTKQWINLSARKARLQAQRDDAADVTFAPDLQALAEENGLGHVLEEQRAEFLARLARFKSEVVILNQRVAAGQDAIAGFESQKRALEEQLAVVSEETERKEKLLDQGLTNRSEYTALLRSQADLIGQIGAIAAQLEQTRTQIAEAKEQLVRQDTQRVEQSLTELNDVTAQIGETEELLSAARDVLTRIVIRAPSDGLIVRINQNTPGSVVGPGEAMAQLLPTSSELIVEAQLSPGDVDIVRPGQDADLRFVALNMRTTPQVPGSVTYVSPDRLIDPKSGQPFFIARLRITDELPPDVDRDQIYPGMPVEALISTGERTFFEYLAKPLTDSFNRAFREQ